MNERMREPFHTLMWKASIGYNDSWSQVDPDVLEKFAELIVKECAELAKLHVMNISTYADAEFVDQQIKEHFGVEE